MWMSPTYTDSRSNVILTFFILLYEQFSFFYRKQTMVRSMINTPVWMSISRNNHEKSKNYKSTWNKKYLNTWSCNTLFIRYACLKSHSAKNSHYFDYHVSNKISVFFFFYLVVRKFIQINQKFLFIKLLGCYDS